MELKQHKKLLKKTNQGLIKSIPTETMEICDYIGNVVGQVEIKRSDLLWKNQWSQHRERNL